MPVSAAQAARLARRARPLLIDRFMDSWDADIIRTRVVDATPDQTYAALRAFDFTKVRSPLVRALLAMARAFQARAVRRGAASRLLPNSLTFDNLEAYGRVLLAEETGAEIVVGGVARPLQMYVTSMKVDPVGFTTFEAPGYVKAAASLSLQPYGERRTLLSYELRMRATDEATKRKLLRALLLFGPIERAAMDAVLDHVAKNAAFRQTD
jgi:hypothetical protein